MKYFLVIILLLLSTTGKLEQNSKLPKEGLELKLDTFNNDLNQLRDEIQNNSNTTVSNKLQQ